MFGICEVVHMIALSENKHRVSVTEITSKLI